jgi:1-acyl-sn-glycerol-3-phosphate acyltransferase
MKLPALPDNVPKIEGQRALRAIGRLFAESSGWRVEALPNVPKAVVLAAPHSSNWDGLFGVCGAFGIGVRINWMGKHQLFRWPIGPVVRAFGGISTDRVLAPEGTRRKVKKWRTGFWHIAQKAGVPIVPGYLHYPDKKIGFGPPLLTSGDMQADLNKLYDFYAPFRGKNGKTGLPSAG